MSVSRIEGYRRGRPLEEAGLVCAERFLADVAEIDTTRIRDATANRLTGDLATASGATIEVKRQPIDPYRYRRNFVEVFETTGNPAHADGLAEVARLLAMPVGELAAAYVRDELQPVGWLPLVSVSLGSMAGSALTVYVNPDAWLYVYDSAVLLGEVRRAVRVDGFRLGAGRSNTGTYAVLVPVPPCVWGWDGVGWVYLGDGDDAFAVAGLRARLTAPSA